MLRKQEVLDREAAAAKEEAMSSLREIQQAVSSVRKRLGHVEEGETFVLQLQVPPTQ